MVNFKVFRIFAFGISLWLLSATALADSRNHCVRKVDPKGTITVVAGTGVAGFSGDGGSADAAQLNGPYGLAMDSAGNLFIADTFNRRIRKVSKDGLISTVAGGGESTTDGVAATEFRLV